MSLHPSLKSSKSLSSKKSVLKRGERIKWLMGKKRWNESLTVLNLPKIKVVRLRVAKKEKKEEKKEETPEEKKEAAS